FPGYDDARQLSDPNDRIGLLEREFLRDVGHPRFIPYLQLHEFETLLLSDPEKIRMAFPDRRAAVRRIADMTRGFSSPEEINDRPETAPSKRIAREIPEYLDAKGSAGPLIARHIGLQTMRTRCPHFDRWLSRLESLSHAQP
ncbi:MAG: DUF4276 family protein, partial [Candidatus Sumerlaeota bacterium]|nr:DUF4276 family protein [Candidatus Sumerlaeota bacterium]